MLIIIIGDLKMDFTIAVDILEAVVMVFMTARAISAVGETASMMEKDICVHGENVFMITKDI